MKKDRRKDDKKKNLATLCACGLTLLLLSVFAWTKAPDSYSDAERRSLARFPVLSIERLETGRFMNEFENYSMDQFPARDGLRRVKALTSRYLFGQKDNHGLYLVNGNLSRLEYPLNESRITASSAKIQNICQQYLDNTDCKSFLCIIPDKNYFLASQGGYPMMDYDRLVDIVEEKNSCDEVIDIRDLLSLEDYYRTDQHWRQEKITDVAERILEAMAQGRDEEVRREEKSGQEEKTGQEETDKEMPDLQEDGIGGNQYQEFVLDTFFYGAYVGQAALPIQPDQIIYLTSEILEQCQVTSYNTGKAKSALMYDMSKAHGKDPYEMFLAGADPLIIIDNPAGPKGKELVIFRDSFGSSLAPLLVENYEKITLVDLRYIQPALLGNYISFDQQDVLFLYSTLILNSTN